MNLKVIILSFVVASFAFGEQSVYSDSSFVDTDVIAKKNSREIFQLKQKISQLQEKIEGLKSIIEGQSSTIEQLRAKTNNNLESIINQLSQRVATLENSISSLKSAQVEQLNRLVSSKNNLEPNIKEEKKESKKVEKKNIPSKELYKQSVLNFTKGKLSKAQDGFKTLLGRSYKRASSNFYLGEIAFKKERYKDAISYYQQSVTLNDSASYMDKLLLHTAISLKKKGKTKEAMNFFNAVITSYPDTSSAKEAKKYLK